MGLKALALCLSSTKEGMDHKINFLSVLMLPPTPGVTGHVAALWPSVISVLMKTVIP